MSSPSLGRQPSRLPQENLAAAFGPPDRAAGLTGLLTPAPRTLPAAESPPAPAEQPTSPRAGQRAPRPRAERPADRDGASSRPLVVIVYLPATLRDRLREAAARQAATYTAMVLQAVDATHQRLEGLLAVNRPASRPQSLFSGSGGTRTRNAEPHVQVSLRLTRTDLEVIDRLVVERQAPNRSALIATCLAAYLHQS